MAEIIDSRDLLTELRVLLLDSTYDYDDDPEELYAKHSTEDEDDQPAAVIAWGDLDEEDRERVQTLRAVLDELPESTVDSPTGNSWGCTLVPEDEFEDHARELAESIGSIDPTSTDWPLSYIDWPRAAEALKMDYTQVELDGVTYYAR